MTTPQPWSPPVPSGYRILQEQRPLRRHWSKTDEFGTRRFQNLNLLFPCLGLPLLQFVVLVRAQKRAENLVGRVSEKVGKCGSVEGSHSATPSRQATRSL